MLFCNGHGAWLPGQIIFFPIKTSDGGVVWPLNTKYGVKLVPDGRMMAVRLHVWVHVWWLEKTIVSLPRPHTRHPLTRSTSPRSPRTSAASTSAATR